MRRGYSLGAAPTGCPPLACPPQRFFLQPAGSRSESDTPALTVSLLLLARLQHWARPPSGAVRIILALRHIPTRLLSPPRRRLHSPAEALPRVPSPRPQSPPQGPPGGSAEAPESLGASPFPAVERRRADSPAQPPPALSAPRSCHPAAALLRAPGLSSPIGALPRRGGGGGGDSPRRRMSGAWAAEGSRAGGCVRPRADPVPRGQMPPALARPPALSSGVPAPAARGPRSLYPPAAASSAGAAASL